MASGFNLKGFRILGILKNNENKLLYQLETSYSDLSPPPPPHTHTAY